MTRELQAGVSASVILFNTSCPAACVMATMAMRRPSRSHRVDGAPGSNCGSAGIQITQPAELRMELGVRADIRVDLGCQTRLGRREAVEASAHPLATLGFEDRVASGDACTTA